MGKERKFVPRAGQVGQYQPLLGTACTPEVFKPLPHNFPINGTVVSLPEPGSLTT
jgi:hypothetical protein